MKERPILFSDPMLAAILADRKKQTRRVVKPQPSAGLRESVFAQSGLEDGHGREIKCRYAVGDFLWVRETWQEFFDDELPTERPRGPRGQMGIPARPDRRAFVFYRADGEILDHPEFGKALWRPSIFMPRWASRITLEITGIRVERLRAITEADAIAEGAFEIGRVGDDPATPLWTMTGEGWRHAEARDAFARYWDTLNAKRPGRSWADNPWVWVINFKRV